MNLRNYITEMESMAMSIRAAAYDQSKSDADILFLVKISNRLEELVDQMKEEQAAFEALEKIE